MELSWQLIPSHEKPNCDGLGYTAQLSSGWEWCVLQHMYMVRYKELKKKKQTMRRSARGDTIEILIGLLNKILPITIKTERYKQKVIN